MPRAADDPRRPVSSRSPRTHLSDAGGWALLLALLKVSLVGLVLFFLKVREVAT